MCAIAALSFSFIATRPAHTIHMFIIIMVVVIVIMMIIVIVIMMIIIIGIIMQKVQKAECQCPFLSIEL